MTLSPNGWGLFDMIGNVSEWCAPAAGGSDAVDPESAKAVRGGSWAEHAAKFCRSAARFEFASSLTTFGLGFRFVVNDKEGDK